MKILILAAMDKEISLLVNLLENPVEGCVKDINFHKGRIHHHEVTIAKCGIGKVNSAVNTYKLILDINPDIVINSGVAGGADAKIGTILVADRVAYHDVWCGPGTIYGQADGIPLFMSVAPEILEIARRNNLETGLICSGDKFISSSEEIKFIRTKFPDVRGVDMESASIAQTCIMTNKKFAVIRVISDTPGEGENISQYKDFWQTAPVKTFETISMILSNLA
ncbi:MAG: 5'-methylthioadenosine/adenosylhomocysteine nucleosidase [Muribaculaceae bacterium]|nr:5'-methylthioadenosine/adenosylhomocysteine nucleosidase [Muribaculaceae bacterium]